MRFQHAPKLIAAICLLVHLEWESLWNCIFLTWSLGTTQNRQFIELRFTMIFCYFVLQVSFICLWVLAACWRTEIGTDLPVRGKLTRTIYFPKKTLVIVYSGKTNINSSQVWGQKWIIFGWDLICFAFYSYWLINSNCYVTANMNCYFLYIEGI